MEYKATGFYDKNNWIIYEGDIVEYINDTYKDTGVIEYQPCGNKYFVTNNMGFGTELNTDNVKQMEAIGRIERNPGLMEHETEYQKHFKEFCIREGYSYNSKHKSREPIILEPEDWTDDEWKVICKLFGMKRADRIVVSNYTLETLGVELKDVIK